MRVLSAKENHFQNLLGIKELVPCKLKLGYVALNPVDSINLSLLLRGQRDPPICVTAGALLCPRTVFEKWNKTWLSSNFLCQQFLPLVTETFFSSWTLPQGKILKSSGYYSKIKFKKYRPGENRKWCDIPRESLQSAACLIGHRHLPRAWFTSTMTLEKYNCRDAKVPSYSSKTKEQWSRKRKNP